jgi:hypothetical protein
VQLRFDSAGSGGEPPRSGGAMAALAGDTATWLEWFFLTSLNPTQAVQRGELTEEGFGWWRDPEQCARQRGSSLGLRRYRQGAPRDGTNRDWFKRAQLSL